MYPLFRLARVLYQARRRPPLPLETVCEIRTRCWPWDLDVFLEMNNGRVLTLFDLGRFDLAVRVGLSAVLRRRRWGLAVAGASVRYRKRVHIGQPIRIRTQVLGRDEKWFYIEQMMQVREQVTSAALLRVCVTGDGKALPTAQVLQALEVDSPWQTPLPDWVQRWIDADADRPWPPHTAQ